MSIAIDARAAYAGPIYAPRFIVTPALTARLSSPSSTYLLDFGGIFFFHFLVCLQLELEGLQCGLQLLRLLLLPRLPFLPFGQWPHAAPAVLPLQIRKV